ncbi:MAG: ACT domain-containing protein [Eubacteriales bacterium]|nr:ACT domain-containing protein [Eubacteriales bacterium]
MEKAPVTDIAITYDVALVTVDNIPGNMNMISKLFNSIAAQNINIDLINQAPPYRGTVNLSFSISTRDIVKTIGTLNRFKKEVPALMVEIDADNTKIAVSGEQMKNIPGVAARLFTILAKNEVDIKLISTSETDISYLVYMKDVDRAVYAIKKEYSL